MSKPSSLTLKIAHTLRELRQVQRLRWKVFYNELGAMPNLLTRLTRRDRDGHDDLCEHLMVLDKQKVVGTTRILKLSRIKSHEGFYSYAAFDLKPLFHSNLNFAELGRTCVLKDYRDKKTIELLWRGIYSYIETQKIDCLFGVASLFNQDKNLIQQQLSYLFHTHLAPNEWLIKAHLDKRHTITLLPKEKLEDKAIFKSLPPLIKAYIKVGAKFGFGAVKDPHFNSVDVFVIMPVKNLNQTYVKRFS